MSTQVYKGYLRGIRGALVTPLNTDGSLPNTVAETKATGITGTVVANNGITYTAVANMGASGNQISAILQDPHGNNQALSVSVSDKTILVKLATGAGGAITSTAALIIAAIIASTPASLLVVPTNTGASTGAGIVLADGIVLTGGIDAQGSNYWVNTAEEAAYSMDVTKGAQDDLRGGDAVLTSVKDPDIVKGMAIAFKDARFDAMLAQIIDGGAIITDGGNIIGYTAPTIAAQANPIPFLMKVYVQSFGSQGSRETYLAYKFVFCKGKIGNGNHTDKTWSAQTFDITCAENPSTLASTYSKQFVDTLPAEAR
jgi:hypothetical protein